MGRKFANLAPHSTMAIACRSLQIFVLSLNLMGEFIGRLVRMMTEEMYFVVLFSVGGAHLKMMSWGVFIRALLR